MKPLQLLVAGLLATVATSALALPTNPWIVNKFMQLMYEVFRSMASSM
jgi:hypothetical protein